MADALLIDAIPGELRAALIEDGRVVEIVFHRAGSESHVGRMFLGRVERVLPGGDAAFVGLGLERAGFLPVGRDETPPHEGASALVQVTKDALDRKGPQLTRRVAVAGRYLVLTPGAAGVSVSRRIGDEAERNRLARAVRALALPGEGFTLRTAAAGATDAALAADAEQLRETWDGIEIAARQARAPALVHAGPDALARLLTDHGDAVARIVIDDAATHASAIAFCRRHMPGLADRIAAHRGDTPLFEAEGIEAEIEQALTPRVTLPSGGEIVIEGTEALTAIDVNSGALSGVARADESALRTNLEAAAEAARQLRLRAIGGLIVIDFIQMDDAAWPRVTGALGAALSRDRTPARLLGRTNAGLVEVTRARGRDSLAQLLGGVARAGQGASVTRSTDTIAFDVLRAIRREARARPGGAIRVAVAPAVAARLDGPERVALAAALGRQIAVAAMADWPRARCEISL